MAQRSVDRPHAIAAAVIISGVAPIFFNVMPLIIGALVEDRGFDNPQAGSLASAYLAGHTFATLALILSVRRFDWRRLVVVFALVQVAGFGLAATVSQYQGLAALLFAAGLGGGGLFATSMTALGDGSHPDRNYGLATLAQTMLPAAIAFLLPLTVLPRFGLGGVLAGIAILAGTCVLWSRWMPAAGKLPARESADTPKIQLGSWAGLGAALLFVSGVSALWAFFERIGSAAGVSNVVIGLVISGSLIAGGLGAVVPVVLGDRIGRTWPIVAAGIILLTCIGLLAAKPGAIVYATCGLMLFFGWTVSIIYQLARLAARDETGQMSAAIPAVIGIGSTLGPVTGGLLAADGQFIGLYAAATASTVITIVIVAINRRKGPSGSSSIA